MMSDYYHQVAPNSHWSDLEVLVLVVSDRKKTVSSSKGMQMTTKTSSLLTVCYNSISCYSVYYVSVGLFVCLSVLTCLYLFVCLSVLTCLSVSGSVCLLFLLVCVSVGLFVFYSYLPVSVGLFVCLSVLTCQCLSVSGSVCLSVLTCLCLCVSGSVCWSVCSYLSVSVCQ